VAALCAAAVGKQTCYEVGLIYGCNVTLVMQKEGGCVASSDTMSLHIHEHHSGVRLCLCELWPLTESLLITQMIHK
jgi:hypothetical protein